MTNNGWYIIKPNQTKPIRLIIKPNQTKPIRLILKFNIHNVTEDVYITAQL